MSTTGFVVPAWLADQYSRLLTAPPQAVLCTLEAATHADDDAELMGWALYDCAKCGRTIYEDDPAHDDDYCAPDGA